MGGIKKDEKVDKKCSMGGFHVHQFFGVSLDPDMIPFSSTTGRKRDSSDSRCFNGFHRVHVIHFGAFLVRVPSQDHSTRLLQRRKGDL